jgi:uncharacterized protein YggE
MSETQERRLFGLVLILVVVVSLLAGFSIYASYAKPGLVTSPAPPEQKTISVGGTGTVSMTPDIGWFTASVVTQAATAAQAEEQNNDAISKVISALKNAGIAEKDMQTVEFSLSPVYSDSKEPGKAPILVGYSVRHSIRVTVNDVTAVGNMLDVAMSNGANEMSGVYFGLSDAKAQQAQSQALDLAVKDANNKAKMIANAMGVNLTGAITVSLGYSYEPLRMDINKAEASAVPITPGQLQYTVNVQVAYAFS